MTEKCPICLEVISKTHPLTPCGHLFHKSCLRLCALFKEEIKCPLCRKGIRLERETRAMASLQHQSTILFAIIANIKMRIYETGGQDKRTQQLAYNLTTHVWENRIIYRKYPNMIKLVKKILFTILDLIPSEIKKEKKVKKAIKECIRKVNIL